jgi:hypothetical protein
MMVDRDNEKPVRRVKVHAFQSQGRPISNEEVSIPEVVMGRDTGG